LAVPIFLAALRTGLFAGAAAALAGAGARVLLATVLLVGTATVEVSVDMVKMDVS
jgi:L-asparagine transporter-like permease